MDRRPMLIIAGRLLAGVFVLAAGLLLIWPSPAGAHPIERPNRPPYVESPSDTLDEDLWVLSTPPTTLGGFWDVTSADLNHDGRLDVVASPLTDMGLYAWLGNGAAGWTLANTGLPGSGIYRGLALADLDRDGDQDLIAASSGTGVGIWLNDGAGNWTAGTGPTATGQFVDVAAGDVDRDGWPDIVAAGAENNGVQAWLGDGGDHWQPANTGLPTSQSYRAVALGDITLSARLDIAALPDNAGIQIYRGTGTGTWWLEDDGLPASSDYRGVALGDLDHDRDLEMVVANAGIGVQVWDRAAGDTWQQVDQGLPGLGVFRDVALADVNNDGWLDIGASLSSGGLRSWIGLGSASFFPASSGLIVSGGYAGLVFGDYDDDGLTDLFAALPGGGGVHVWHNNRTPPPWLGWSAGVDPGGLWQDVALSPNGLVAVGTASSCVGIWTGDGSSWSADPDPPCANDGLVAVVVTELNHDSAWDLVVATEGLGLRVWIGGNEWVSFDDNLPTTGAYNRVALGDLDQDSNLDLAAASASQGIRFWFGNGAGHWTEHSGGLPDSGGYWDIHFVDMNHDGVLDLVASSLDDLGIEIYRGVPDLVTPWASVGPTWVGTYYGLDIGDINDDGNLDIAAARTGIDNIEMYLGDGAFGVITTTTPFIAPVLTYARDVALGDVDHNGKLDLAVIGLDPALQLGQLSFWLGDGGDTWALASPPNAIADGARVVMGPLNNDAKLDMVAIKETGALWPWLAGDFTAPSSWFPYTPQGWVTDTQTVTCTSSVHDTQSGLDLTRARYSYSTDDGASWSDWIQADCSGSSGITSTQTMTASAVAFGQDSGLGHETLIRYLIRDIAGNWGLSPDRRVLIDTTLPQNPTAFESSSHQTGVWHNDNTVALEWSGASDATSGVDGYGILWDHDPATLPDPAVTTAFTDTISDPLPDGADWWVHLRTADAAGHWTVDGLHLGPVQIDTTAPTNPTFLDSTSHYVGEWSRDNTVDVVWSGAGDASSGVSGYSIMWSRSPASIPNQTVDTTETAATSSPLSDHDDWYFHVRTSDEAGNWSADAVHLGPFLIDTLAPVNPTILSSHSRVSWSNNPTITMTWTGASDQGCGVAGYGIALDTNPASDVITDLLFTATTLAFPDRPDGNYYFHLRTCDNAANCSELVHSGPYRIDTVPPGDAGNAYSDPPTDEWTNDTTIYVNWSQAPAGEGSPLDGYSTLWSLLPGDEPDNTVNEFYSDAHSGGHTETSGTYYLFVKAGDQADNWGNTVRFGPFLLDRDRPDDPGPVTSSTHQENQVSVLDTVWTSWSPGSDTGGSGIAGYSVLWSQNPAASPNDIVDTVPTRYHSAPLPDGDWYFSVKAIDAAGNASAEQSTFGPLLIRPAHLQTSITPGILDPHPGQSVGYTVDAANTGTGTAQNVLLEVTLPDHLAFSECSLGCTHLNGVITWELDPLGPDETVQTAFYVDVDPAGSHGQVLRTDATLSATDTASAAASATTHIQIPACPIVSARYWDAAPDAHIYTLIPDEDLGSSYTTAQIQVRLTTDLVETSQNVHVLVSIRDDRLGPPTDVLHRLWSAGTLTDAVWESLGNGVYSTTVDLSWNPTYNEYTRQVLFSFSIEPDQSMGQLDYQVTVDQYGRNCYQGQVETTLTGTADVIVITNRHHLFASYDTDEVDVLLQRLYAEVDGQDGRPRGVVYYLDEYDSEMLDWDNTDLDWSDSDSVNEVADTIVNRLISRWYQDAASTSSRYVDEIINAPDYLLIVGDDHIVPLHREPDPSGNEDDSPSALNVVLDELTSHGYIFDDGFYRVPLWNLYDPPDWRRGESLWAVGRLVGASAEDMRSLLTNGVQGPSAGSDNWIAASYDGSDLDYRYPALDAIRDWGYNVRNDVEAPVTVENDTWFTITLVALMQQRFDGFYYAGHGEPRLITAPQGGNHDALWGSQIEARAGSFAGDRPFFVLQSCRVGQAYTPDGPSASFIYALIHNRISGALAAGGKTWYWRPYNGDAYGEELAQLFVTKLFASGRQETFGKALQQALEEYDPKDSWDSRDTKTVMEFLLYGVPWGTLPPADVVGRAMQPPLTAPAAQSRPLQISAGAAITSAGPWTVTLTADLDASAYTTDTSTIPGYDLLHIPGYDQLHVIERPLLPARHLTFTLPLQAQVLGASIVLTDPVTLSGLDLPMPVESSPDPTYAAIILTDTIDWVGTWPTETIRIHLQRRDGSAVGHIWAMPAQADPVTDQVTLYQSGRLTVTYQINRPLLVSHLVMPAATPLGEPIPARSVIANASPVTLTVFPILSLYDPEGNQVGLTVGDRVTVSALHAQVVQINWTRPLTQGRYLAVLSLVRGGTVWVQRIRPLAVLGTSVEWLTGPDVVYAGETAVFDLSLVNHHPISTPITVTLQIQNPLTGATLKLGEQYVLLEGGLSRSLRLTWPVPAHWTQALVGVQVTTPTASYQSRILDLPIHPRLFLPLLLRNAP